MYEELIYALREHADKMCVAFKGAHACGSNLALEAADAIEKLQAGEKKFLRNISALETENENLKRARRWIPVTEWLPEDGVFVLVCNDDGHMMIAKHESETYEWYYKYTNYDFDIWDNEEQGPVCYWMPLSEPPKEK